MKKLILVLALATSLWSQAVRVDPQPATTIAPNTPPGALAPVLAIPGATITLCGYPANSSKPCTNTANTYTSLTGTTTCPSNQQVTLAGGGQCTGVADAQGNFGFYLLAGTYAYEITYQGTTFGPYTLSVGGAGSGPGGGISGLTGDVSATGPGAATATVQGIRNVAIPALTIGKLSFNGSSWFFDNSGGTGGQITFTATQDVTGTATGTSTLSPALTVAGLRGQPLPALSSGLLRYTVSNGWTFDSNNYYYPGIVPPNQPCVGTNATSQFVAGNCSGTGGGMTALTGDVTAGPGSGSQAAIVHAIDGTLVPVNSAADQVLTTISPQTGNWTSLPNCPDTGGNHLNYLTSSHAFLCGTSGGGTGSGITSMQVVVPPSFLTVSPSSACTTGACLFAIGLANIPANTVLAGPASGAAGGPAARALVAADLPPIPAASLFYTAPGSGASPITLQNQITATTILAASYGVVCDGTATSGTDNAPALQAAINALNNASTFAGAVLQLPEPTAPGNVCYIGSTINISMPGVIIRGIRGATQAVAGSSTIGVTVGPIIKAMGNQAAYGNSLGTMFHITGSNVKFESFGIDGSAQYFGIGIPALNKFAGGTTYYASGGAFGPYGGASTTAVLSGTNTVNIYYPNRTDTGTNLGTPPNSNWTQLGSAINNTALYNWVNSGAGGVNGQNGNLITIDNTSGFTSEGMDYTGGMFGIFFYATTQPIANIQIYNSNFHDFNQYVPPGQSGYTGIPAIGVQSGGNQGSMVPLQTYCTQLCSDFKIIGNHFMNIYIPGPTGPGNSVTGIIGASGVDFSLNYVKDVINNHGGTALTGATGSKNWVMNGNTLLRVGSGYSFPSDLTDAWEIELENFSISGNTAFGFVTCFALTDFNGWYTGWGSVTGNQCIGPTPTVANNNYGFLLDPNNLVDGVQAVNFTGNTLTNYQSAWWIGGKASYNITASANNYFGITGPFCVGFCNNQTFVAPYDTGLYPSNNNGSTIVLTQQAPQIYYFTKTLPLFDGDKSIAQVPGTTFNLHASMTTSNTSATGIYIDPVIWFGTAYAQATNSIQVGPQSTGVINIDVQCNVTVLASSGTVFCSGQAWYTPAGTTSATTVYSIAGNIGTNTLAWGPGAVAQLGFYGASPGAGMSLTSSDITWSVRYPYAVQ